jgi:GR25 family glycosyltransferase involved in LPS biosynthesis
MILIGPDCFFKDSFVINTAKREDRRQLFESMLKRADIGVVKRFEAIVDLKDGAWGCAQSHLAIVRIAKERALENILIFEDDAQFVESFSEQLRPALNELDTLNWNFFYLGGRMMTDAKKISLYLAKIGMIYTTHAYAVKHTMYDEILKYDHKRDIAIDVHYANLTCRNPSYACLPIAVHQRPGYSDLLKGWCNYKKLCDASYIEKLK